MNNQQDLYDQFGSAFQGGPAAGMGANWKQRMQGGGGKMAEFSGNLGNTFSAPSSTNGAEEMAYGDGLEASNSQQWGNNLSRVASGQDQMANLGFNAVSSKQSYLQAKTMAKLQAQSAEAQATQSMIGSGLSMLGSIGGFARAGGFGKSASGGSGISPAAQAKANAYGARAFSLPSSSFRYF